MRQWQAVLPCTRPSGSEPEPPGRDGENLNRFKMVTNRFRTYAAAALKNSIQMAEQLFYPLKCLKCGRYLNPDAVAPQTLEACFCDSCMGEGFYPIEPPFCTKCGVKFHTGARENHVCESCLKHPLNLSRVRAVSEYKGITKEAIPLFKYHSKLSITKVFEHLLFQAYLHHYHGAGIDRIIPVPLHRKKLRKRGFNQAFLLIRNFADLYRKRFDRPPSWKIDTESLARMKATAPQTGYDIEQRRRNLKNAFGVVTQENIKNSRLLLIDDVFTTGATCNEAARVLLMHGAKRVDALVLARA